MIRWPDLFFIELDVEIVDDIVHVHIVHIIDRIWFMLSQKGQLRIESSVIDLLEVDAGLRI